MQLVVLSAVMMEAMMLLMIWRMVFHVSLLFFMVLDGFLGVNDFIDFSLRGRGAKGAFR